MTSVESERMRLVTNNEEITPVDYVHVRRQRRQVCVGVAIACCLGVGLSLAIAIPLVNQQSLPSSGTASDGTSDGKLMMSAAEGAPSQVRKMMQVLPDDATHEEHHTEFTTTTVDAITTEVQETTHPRHHFTWPTRRTRPTDMTRRTLVPRDQTTTATTHPATTETTTPSWLPEECPRIPHLLRAPVDIKDLVDTVWYEVKRIQTFNAPAYVDHVSCSTLKVNMTTNGSEPASDADLLLSWEEGQLFMRWRKEVTLHLHRNDSESADWVETTSENTDTSQFSFLARLDSFLLTYECFPKVRYFPAPGYIIRVFTRDLSRLSSGRYGQGIVDVMLGLADWWGLNNAFVSPITIRQRFCDLNVGHE